MSLAAHHPGPAHHLASCPRGACPTREQERCQGPARCLRGCLPCTRSRRDVPCPGRCRHWAGSQESCGPWALVARGPGCPWVQGMSEKKEGTHWHSPRWGQGDCLQVRGAHWCLKRGLGRRPPWFWGLKGHCPRSMASLRLLCPVSLSPAGGWCRQICCTLPSAWPGGWSHSELPPVGRGKRCLEGGGEAGREADSAEGEQSQGPRNSGRGWEGGVEGPVSSGPQGRAPKSHGRGARSGGSLATGGRRQEAGGWRLGAGGWRQEGGGGGKEAGGRGWKQRQRLEAEVGGWRQEAEAGGHCGVAGRCQASEEQEPLLGYSAAGTDSTEVR